MTRRSSFRQPKKVLLFNEHGVMGGLLKSVHFASQILNISAQTISRCCTGKLVSSHGLYFRHAHSDIKIEDDDVDTLTVEEYDRLCGVKRQYHSAREMKNRRNKALGIDN